MGRERFTARSSLAALALAAVLLSTHLGQGNAAAKPPEAIEAADLSTLQAKARVRDRTFRGPVRARAAALSTQSFVDDHGHTLVLSTDIPALDLAPYAAVLAGTYHYGEVEDLAVQVVDPSAVEGICGAGAAACYYAEDALRSFRGTMIIPSQHFDLWHVIVHEYGHHVDNQLANLGHVFAGGACGFDNDGSRNWFFERDVEDNILGRGTSCDPASAWDKLLGELYAEDYAWLVGNRSWVLGRERSPTRLQLKALEYDFDRPLDIRTSRVRRWTPLNRVRTFKYLRIDDWRFVTATLRGPRYADLDLYVYRRGARRPLARSTRRGSRETIDRILPPGRYEVAVDAYRYPASGSVRVRLE